MFKLGDSTIREILYDTCDVLHNIPIYLAPPTHEWTKIAEDFELKSNWKCFRYFNCSVEYFKNNFDNESQKCGQNYYGHNCVA